MSSDSNFRLRCSYVKQGRLAMLSHLEIAHALERAVRRAGLPFAVSQGFSPHMRIAFGAALSVGVGSTCEIFDLLLTNYVAPQRALAALQQASVPDLMVQECHYIEHRDAAASVAYPFSRYEVLLSQPVEALQAPESLTVIRKKKEKSLIVSDYLQGDIQVQGAHVFFTLEAKATGSLRPDVLLESCLREHPGVVVRSITRVAQAASLSALNSVQ